MSLLSESFEIYQQGGAEALEAWRSKLSPEDLSELTRQVAEAAQAIQNAFATAFPDIQEAANRLAAAMNEGKVR